MRRNERMNDSLSHFPTKELVNELIRREGVEHTVSKHGHLLHIRLNGPAIVLVITD